MALMKQNEMEFDLALVWISVLIMQ